MDEPILSAFGSSTYVSVQRDDVVALLEEMVQAIHADGALCGVHCCGNTEWSILMDAGVDIVNFDAFEFGETIAMYPEQVKKHFDAGRILAWGVVPTSEKIREQSVESLVAQYEAMVKALVEASGIDADLIHEQTIITPSCGTGSLTPDLAKRVLMLTREVSAGLRKKHAVNYE